VLLEFSGKLDVLDKPLFMILWFVFFAGIQFVILKCPHCGRAAVQEDDLPGDSISILGAIERTTF
jgi:hypothetical protein